jgi:hypothetical protein
MTSLAEEHLGKAMLAEAIASGTMQKSTYKETVKTRPHLGRMGPTALIMCDRLSDRPQTIEEVGEGIAVSRDSKRKTMQRLEMKGLARRTGETRVNENLWVKA